MAPTQPPLAPADRDQISHVWALHCCRTELVSYWPLVRPGGLLMGDDFNWFAVSHDVQLFARSHNLTLYSFDRCHETLRDTPATERVTRTCVWYMRKEEAEARRGPPRKALRTNGKGGGAAS